MNWQQQDSAKTYASQVAEHRGWKVNPDESLTGFVYQGLQTNALKYKFPYCPCRDILGNQANEKALICPCAYAQPDIEEFGQCYCGLYLAQNKDPEEVTSIPERHQE